MTERHPQNEACKLEFERLRSDLKDLTRGDKISSNDITKLEASSHSAHKRIDSMDKYVETIIRISTSMDNAIGEMKEILIVLKKHNERITNLENKPAQTVYGYFQLGITTMISAIVGFVVAILLF